MDLGIVGIVDIVIIIGTIIFAIIGYKKGFSKKILSFFTVLLFIGIAFVFCGQLAELVISNNFDSFISDGIYEKLSVIDDASGYKDLIVRGLDVPNFVGHFLANGVAKMGDFDITTAATYSTEYITKCLLSIICFVVIFIFLIVLAAILRAIGRHRETNVFIRIVDGILGIICYIALWAIIVCVLFYVLSLFMNFTWFSKAKDFLTVDMQLSTDEFRISKIIYNGNFVKNLIEFLFG